MSTTPTAVRESLVTLIEALAPSTLVADGFARYLDDIPFPAWAEENISACFRRFSLRYAPPAHPPEVVNGHSGRWRYPFTLEIAYPRVLYKTVPTTSNLDQVIDEDFAQVHAVLRDYAGASYVAGEATHERATEDKAETTLLRLGVVFELWRDV